MCASSTTSVTSAAWLQRIGGLPINPETLLATDYLNHFNEVIMLLAMVLDVPEVLQDLQSWKAKSYTEHFRTSSLSYGELAAEAYACVPALYKEPFETTIHQLKTVAQSIIAQVIAAKGASERADLAPAMHSAVLTMTTLVASADAIIAGGREILKQDAIDHLLVK